MMRVNRVSSVLRGGALLCGLIVLIGASPLAGTAEGATYHVTSRTIGDVYSHLRASWNDDDPIRRQRIHQILGLNVFDLGGDGTNRIRFLSSMRLDVDFGVSAEEVQRYRGLEQNQFALMYGYLDWTGIWDFMDLRVGRQYEMDAIDMVLYDGARLRFYPLTYFGVETLAGLEAVDGLGPTVSSHTVDGTPGGPLLLSGQYGEREARLVVGGGVFTHNLQYTHVDLTYRRIQTLGDGVQSEQTGKPGVNQERVGIAASQRVMEGLFVNGGGSYDFFLASMNEILGGVRYRPVFEWEVEAKYHYLLPSFDADSIWNVFSWRPMDRFEERIRWFESEDAWLYAGTYQSFFRADDSVTNEDVSSVVQDLGFTAGGVWRIQPDSHVRIDVTTEVGYGGRQTFFDVGGGTLFRGGAFGLDGRLLLILFEDEQQPRLNGTMIGAQLEGMWNFMEGGKASLLVEEASSELQPHWLRLMAVVDLEFWR